MQCSKCGGTGIVECFRHIADGVCFQCKGSGVEEPKPRRVVEYNSTGTGENLSGQQERMLLDKYIINKRPVMMNGKTYKYLQVLPTDLRCDGFPYVVQKQGNNIVLWRKNTKWHFCVPLCYRKLLQKYFKFQKGA